MLKSKYLHLLLSLVLLASLVLVSCGPQPTPEPTEEPAPAVEEAEPAEEAEAEEAEAEPAEEEEVAEYTPVIMMTRTGAEADALRAVAEAYEEATGKHVEVNEQGRAGYFDTLSTRLLAGLPDVDLVFFPSTYVGQFAEAGTLEPLDEYMNLTDPEELDAEDLLVTYGYKGSTYALPTDLSAHFLYYRSDLIPEPPQTWEEVMEIAPKWTQSLNPDSPTVYGAGFDALAPEEGPKIFYTGMWSRGGWIIDEEGNVGVNSEGAVAHGDMWRQMIDEGLISPETSNLGFGEIMEALGNGTIAMGTPFWNAAYGLILTSDMPEKDNIKITMAPGVKQEDGSIYRTPFQHGWTLVMNAASENKEEAWKFMVWATGKEGGLVHAKAGGTPARASVLGDPQFAETRPDFALMLESLKVAKAEPMVTYYDEMHEAMNVALARILNEGWEAQDALDEAAATIEELAANAP